MRFDKEAIKKRFNEGETLEFVFFWKHTEEPGKIGKTCLSQWYPCEFDADGVIYRTTEQYMMAHKALLFQDKEIYKKIMEASHPRDYKALGRFVKNFDEKLWNEQKEEIVLQGNLAKFSQNAELKSFLIGTGNKILVEASPYDKVWGVGFSAEDQKILNPNNWKGENLLGRALMGTREILMNR